MKLLQHSEVDWLTQRTHYTAEEVQILHAGILCHIHYPTGQLCSEQRRQLCSVFFSDFSLSCFSPLRFLSPQVSFVTFLRAESSEVTLRFSSSVARLARKWQTWSSGLLVFQSDNHLTNHFQCHIHSNEPG